MIRRTKQLTPEEHRYYTSIESELEVVLDVGAVNSFFNELDCEVHFFEPITSRFDELVRITEKRERYFFNKTGCGSFDGELDIFTDIASTQWRDVPAKFGKRKKELIETIPVVTLEKYIQDHCIDNVSLLKLDIEGGEYEALKGLGSMLPRCQRIAFEYAWDTADAFSFRLRNILDILEEGFTVFAMTRSGLSPVNEQVMERRVRPNNHNLIALRKGGDE